MDIIQYVLLAVFVVATIVGYKLINNVPSLLHTPLMSGMNALSGVTVLGALTASAIAFSQVSIILSALLGVFAIALAMVNVVGGFAVTDRMLKMIAKKADEKAKLINTLIVVGSAIVVAGIVYLFFAPIAYRQYIYYALCAALSLGVLEGIALMSKVKLSPIGNKLSGICMLLGIILTLIYNGILPIWTLYVGMVIGTVVGYYLAAKVKMIQMPQMVALLNGLGGAASAIVGGFAMFGIGTATDAFSSTTSALASAVGMLTLTGSLVAAGKLHKILPQKPVIYKFHRTMTTGSLLATLVSVVLFVVFVVLSKGATSALPIVFAILTFLLSGFFGYIFAIRVGGADMPITISLLNSFSGVAGAIAGLAINDLLLVAVGGIVGASGLLLTQIMCRSMNRKIMDILLGKTSAQPSVKNKEVANVTPKATLVEDKAVEVKTNPAASLKTAKNVIIVPGYGMAIAQAQHLVKQLADKLTANGTKIKYAVHPVAGRMPGHMNVLLCEADVDYEDLYEMDDINPEFEKVDATIVVGANDVMNPAAREAVGTPIYGMPVLSVDKCKNVFIFNYDLKPGYAGVENPLYTRESGVTKYLGNAAETLATFIADIDKPETTEVETKAVEVKANPAASLKTAKNVIIVPGYGMAIAQAQ
ncbi:MAG: NAD(P)(+) transhydrogenase (Re/Si-specific) subunit beta, partial [Clostridia bacterium]